MSQIDTTMSRFDTTMEPMQIVNAINAIDKTNLIYIVVALYSIRYILSGLGELLRVVWEILKEIGI